MASKKILLLLDSDRHSFALLHFLTENAKLYGWKIKVGTMFDPQIAVRLKSETFLLTPEFADFSKPQEYEQAIKKSDVVVGMVQDSLLIQVADSCIKYRKTLVSPARLTRQMALKKSLAKENNALILMDCGFSPGLDHIIAKKAIDNIHYKGGKILSFRTYSGTVVSQSDAGPWEFKPAESAAELMSWGKHNNRLLLNGQIKHIPGYRLFERSEPIKLRDEEFMVAIPEGDSLYFKKIYDLVDAHTVIRGKLVRKGFERIWNLLVQLGLTDSSLKIDFAGDPSYYNLLDSLLPPSSSSTIEERLQRYCGADADDIDKLKSIGLFDNTPLNDFQRETSPAQLLQQLLEEKLSMKSGDKDSIVMEHQMVYELRDEMFELGATLILEGDGGQHSALSRVTGLICGAAVKSILIGSLNVKGLHIPTLREIYDPILNELEEQGMAFHIRDGRSVPVANHAFS